jgi:hypothetical protein
MLWASRSISASSGGSCARNSSVGWRGIHGNAGSGGRTMIPSSSTQIPVGTLTTPSSSSSTWAESISAGWLVFARSIHGAAASIPPVSSATLTTSKPSG